jgi:hypothetical protein
MSESTTPELVIAPRPSAERIAALERVAEAARVVTADGGSATDGCGCEWCTLLDALRRLEEVERD